MGPAQETMIVMTTDDGELPPTPKTSRRPSLLRRGSWRRKSKKDPVRTSTVGDDLDILHQDQVIKTQPSDNKWRRTLQLRRDQNASWGFTIQSYGIHHKSSGEVEMLTYVDYVEMGGAAYLAGLRPGDVIMSIDGVSMESADHPALVHYIKAAGNTMRLVVLFEDCVRKIDLHLKSIKLQQLLADKMFELRSLEAVENRVLNGENLLDASNRSCASSTSTLNSNWCDTTSLRPDFDVCPSPRQFSSRSPWQQRSVSPMQRSVSPMQRSVSPMQSRSPSLCPSPMAERKPSLNAQESSQYLEVPSPRQQSPKQQQHQPDSFNVGVSHQQSFSESDVNRQDHQEFYTLPRRGKRGADSHTISETNVDSVPRPLPEKSPDTSTSGTSTLPRRTVNASVSGDISYVRDRLPSRPSWASFASFRSDTYCVSSKSKKTLKKSNSNRWSFRRRIQGNEIKMKHMKEASEHVVMEDSRYNSGEPELISLRRLCNDFRMDYLHNSLVAGHRAQDVVTAMMSQQNNTPNNPMGISRSSLTASSNITQFYISDYDSVSVRSHESNIPCPNQEWMAMNELSSDMSKSSLSGNPEKLSCTDSVLTTLSVYSLESDVFDSRSPSPCLTPSGIRSNSPVPDSEVTHHLELINEDDEDTRL